MSLGGSKKKSNSSQTENFSRQQNPYAPVIPYLTGALGDASNLYQQGGFSYSGPTYAGMNSAQDAALQQAIQQGMSGPAGAGAGEQAMTDLLQGRGDVATSLLDFMTPQGNPYLGQMVDQAIGKVQSGVNSGIGLTGRAGSGFHAAALGDAAGNVATNMYGQAYDGDMSRALGATQALGGLQSDAIGNLLNLFSGRMAGTNAALQAGNAYQQDEQAQLDAAREAAMAPADNLANWLNVLMGIGGMGGTESGTATGVSKGKSSGLSFGFGLGG